MALPLVPVLLLGAKSALIYTVYDRVKKRREERPVRPVRNTCSREDVAVKTKSTRTECDNPTDQPG